MISSTALKKLSVLLLLAGVTAACVCLNYVELLAPATATPTPTDIPPPPTASPTPTTPPTATPLPPTSTATSPPPPTATSSLTPVPSPGTVLLQDDFSNPDSGWEIGSFQEGQVGYTSGQYFVEASEEDQMMWGLYDQPLKNTVIQVDTQQIKAPPSDNNAYGVLCRTQENGDGYLLRISGDGLYSISKVIHEEFIYLIEWTQSTLINQGNAGNTITAVCDGPELRLLINGDLAAEAADDTFTEGKIGLTATSYEEEGTLVYFDNVVVKQGKFQE